MNANKLPRQPSVVRVIHQKKERRLEKEMLENRAGIYAIVNRKNNNRYVGQASDLEGRKRDHFKLLARNKHHNPHLQNSYNLYGEKAFVFVVLEYVPKPANLNDQEQYWIEKLKPEYNIIMNVFEGFAACVEKEVDECEYQPRVEYEQFYRPKWHQWVYGGGRNPLLDSRKGGKI